MTVVIKTGAALCLAAGLFTAAHAAQSSSRQPMASALLKNKDGMEIGTTTFKQMAGGGTHIRLELMNVMPGTHAVHVHETGKCEGDFTSAGGHFNPTSRSHGFAEGQGMHAGDLPNVHVSASGKLTVEFFARQMSLNALDQGFLFDDDGSAFVVHEGADDYASQPAGDAGPRMACGVIERSSASASDTPAKR